MISPVTVFVPCDIVPVRVEYVYGDGLSPLEEGVLRALVAGFNTVGALTSLLGLGERLTLDLVSDLWHRSYVTLDVSAGTMVASAEVARALADGDVARLGGAERGGETRHVMVERLTGHVLPARQGTNRVRDNRMIVQVGDDGWADELTGADVAGALDDEEPEHGARGEESLLVRRRRVVSAYRVPLRLGAAEGQRWLPLSVRVGIDPDTDSLKVEVLPGSALPADRVAAAAQRIGSVIEEFPDSEFARHLRGCAGTPLDVSPPVEELLDRLERRVAKAPGEPAGARTGFHRDLVAEATLVHRMIRLRVRAEVESRLVVGPEDHLSSVLEIIATARKQVVLACPEIRRRGFQPLLAPLREALARGVQVAVVWGSGHDQRLDDWVKSALYDLRGRANHTGVPQFRTLWSAAPSRMNARLVLGDDRRALVTGAELLAGTIGASQVGIDVAAPPGVNVCEPIEALLHRVARVMPEYRLSQALFTRSGDFRSSDDDVTEPDELFLPEPPHDRPGDELATSAALAWAGAWASVVEALRAMLAARTRPWAQVLADSEHSDALWRVLRTPQQRISIGSRVMNTHVVTSRFVAAVRQQAEDGAVVDLRYQRYGEGENSGPLSTAQSVDPMRVRVERVRSAPGVLATDGETVVSGFDLLSSISRVKGATNRPYRLELGVRIVDASFAARVHDLFTGVTPEEPPELESQALAGTPAVLPRPSGAQLLLNQLAATEAEPARLDLVRSAVAESVNPLELVTELHQMRPGDVVLRTAAAALVARTDLSQAERVPWIEHLVLDQWWSGSFVSAAMLRRAIPDESWSPRRWLTALAAAHRTSWSPQAVEASLTDDLRPVEMATIAAVAAADLLLRPVDEVADEDMTALADSLELLTEVPEPWDRIAALALAYWTQHRAPVPLRDILRIIDHSRREDDITKAWQHLEERHEHAAGTSFDFINGQRVHAWLFQADGVFGQLESVLRGRDAEALQKWLGVRGGTEPGVLIDRASAEALPRGGAIHGKRRRSYEQRLTTVVDAARRVHELTSAWSPREDSAWVDDVRPLGAALVELWPRLTAELGRTEEPERRLITAALEALEPVKQWGSL